MMELSEMQSEKWPRNDIPHGEKKKGKEKFDEKILCNGNMGILSRTNAHKSYSQAKNLVGKPPKMDSHSPTNTPF